MRQEFSESKRQKRLFQRFMKVLVISGLLNVLLVAYFFYNYIKEIPPVPYYELKPATPSKPLFQQEFTNRQALSSFKEMSLEQLVAKLQNTQLVEDGYTQRDLALGSLVAYYDFDLSKALLGQQPTQSRQLVIRTQEGSHEMIVYPGLQLAQWQAIVQFAQTERWPLTTRGLFMLLQKQGNQADPTLLEAFSLTPEWLAVEMLLSRGEQPVTKRELFLVLCDGKWEMLAQFAAEQRVAQDLSAERRQKFLADYIACHSNHAAYLLLKTDKFFAAKKLDDATAAVMLDLLTEKRPESEWFAIELLTSPRGNGVWQAAALRLYQYAGETLPLPYDHRTALARFVSKELLREKFEKIPSTILATPKVIQNNVVKSNPPPSKPLSKPVATRPTPRLHIVQKGESLWKISKRYNVSVDYLMQRNKLYSDSLSPGMALVVN